MKKQLYTAIIAGGQGTRLFPLSHKARPKQFCPFDNQRTFLQMTVERFKSFGVSAKNIIIVTTSASQSALARSQSAPFGVPARNILRLDPQGGYACAMVEAAAFIYRRDRNAVIINSPADQYIELNADFNRALTDAVTNATRGNATIVGVKIDDLITFTGCGHALYSASETGPCKRVSGFIEKPNATTAVKMMRADCSACNTGINVWRADTVLNATAGQDTVGMTTDRLMGCFAPAQLQLTVGNFGWHDCGTLKSLYDVLEKNPDDQNACLGKGATFLSDCKRSLFVVPDGFRLQAENVHDTAIVINVIDDRPVICVVKMTQSQNVRRLAEDYDRSQNAREQSDRTADDAPLSVEAHDNFIVPTTIADRILAGFVGVQNYAVEPRLERGEIVFNVGLANATA